MGLLSGLLGHASDVTPEQTREELEGILLPDEPVEVAFKVIRDLFVFTDQTSDPGGQTGPHQPEGRLLGRSLQGHHLLFDRNGRHAGHGFGAKDLDIWPRRSDPEDAQARGKYSRYPGCHRRGSLSLARGAAQFIRSAASTLFGRHQQRIPAWVPRHSRWLRSPW